MRYLLAIPVSAILIGLFNFIASADMMMDPESLVYEAVLPSAAEFYLKLGELLMAAGILALAGAAWRVIKCPAIVPVAAVLAGIVAVIAIVEFFAVIWCGTPTFFFLMLIAVAECAITCMAWARRAI
jgi:hypothetical protein